jgi:hypothetical protein
VIGESDPGSLASSRTKSLLYQHVILVYDMADITRVSNEDEFIQAIVPNDDLELTDEGASELWRVWEFRYSNGAEDDVLVALPGWFAREEFDRSWPYFFAKVEHDDPDKGAILFKDARLINVNVVENAIWDDVTISETVETLDISDENEHIDEKGKVWTPRSLMSIYGMVDESETGGSGLTDIASQQ